MTKEVVELGGNERRSSLRRHGSCRARLCVCLCESFDLVSAELNQKEGKLEVTAALNR